MDILFVLLIPVVFFTIWIWHSRILLRAYRSMIVAIGGSLISSLVITAAVFYVIAIVFDPTGSFEKQKIIEQRIEAAEAAGFDSVKEHQKALSLGLSTRLEYHDHLTKEWLKEVASEAERKVAREEARKERRRGLISDGIKSGTAVSVGGQVACLRKAWFDDMVKFRVADDRNSFHTYVEKGKCTVLPKGLTVTITEYPGFLGGVTGFAYNGTKMWAAREAFNY